jgi:hypothetical protein
LDRSFQALTELSLRSGEKKAGAVGMSRVIACHTKEVLMHSKHTWYSYGIHMVFIWYSYGIQWYPMKERGTKMLCETGRGEIHAQTLGLSGRIPGNWCSQCAMATAISTEGAVKNSPIHSYSSLLVFALFALLL